MLQLQLLRNEFVCIHGNKRSKQNWVLHVNRGVTYTGSLIYLATVVCHYYSAARVGVRLSG